MPEVAETSGASERAFAVGHAAGAAARSLLRDGVLVEYQDDLRRAVAVTRETLATHPDPGLRRRARSRWRIDSR